MKTSIIKSITIIFSTLLFFTGCAGGSTSITNAFENLVAPSRLKTYSNVVDRTMVDTFYVLSKDGVTQGLTQDFSKTPFKFENISLSSLSIKQHIFTLNNMQQAIDHMNNYTYDGESDEIAKKYISTAKSRGNIVKLYKPKIGKIINNKFQQPITPGERTRQWYESDDALIEFNKSGKIISFMSRAEQAATSLGVYIYQYTTIYTGPGNSKILENNLKNSDLQEYFIRDL